MQRALAMFVSLLLHAMSITAVVCTVFDLAATDEIAEPSDSDRAVARAVSAAVAMVGLADPDWRVAAKAGRGGTSPQLAKAASGGWDASTGWLRDSMLTVSTQSGDCRQLTLSKWPGAEAIAQINAGGERAAILSLWDSLALDRLLWCRAEGEWPFSHKPSRTWAEGRDRVTIGAFFPRLVQGFAVDGQGVTCQVVHGRDGDSTLSIVLNSRGTVSTGDGARPLIGRDEARAAFIGSFSGIARSAELADVGRVNYDEASVTCSEKPKWVAPIPVFLGGVLPTDGSRSEKLRLAYFLSMDAKVTVRNTARDVSAMAMGYIDAWNGQLVGGYLDGDFERKTLREHHADGERPAEVEVIASRNSSLSRAVCVACIAAQLRFADSANKIVVPRISLVTQEGNSRSGVVVTVPGITEFTIDSSSGCVVRYSALGVANRKIEVAGASDRVVGDMIKRWKVIPSAGYYDYGIRFEVDECSRLPDGRLFLPRVFEKRLFLDEGVLLSAFVADREEFGGFEVWSALSLVGKHDEVLKEADAARVASLVAGEWGGFVAAAGSRVPLPEKVPVLVASTELRYTHADGSVWRQRLLSPIRLKAPIVLVRVFTAQIRAGEKVSKVSVFYDVAAGKIVGGEVLDPE